MDDGGEQLDGDTTYRDARDLKAEHALATFDERNRFVANLLYELPVGPGKSINVPNRFLNALAGGWQANCIFADHSGQPFTPELNFNPANTNAGDARPNRIANGNPPSGEKNGATLVRYGGLCGWSSVSIRQRRAKYTDWTGSGRHRFQRLQVVRVAGFRRAEHVAVPG
jgi:hypothetical protein